MQDVVASRSTGAGFTFLSGSGWGPGEPGRIVGSLYSLVAIKLE